MTFTRTRCDSSGRSWDYQRRLCTDILFQVCSNYPRSHMTWLLQSSFPVLYHLIPSPLPPHSQSSTTSFPVLYHLIPSPLPPHSQSSTTSFPVLYHSYRHLQYERYLYLYCMQQYSCRRGLLQLCHMTVVSS